LFPVFSALRTKLGLNRGGVVLGIEFVTIILIIMQKCLIIYFVYAASRCIYWVFKFFVQNDISHIFSPLSAYSVIPSALLYHTNPKLPYYSYIFSPKKDGGTVPRLPRFVQTLRCHTS
jgi:hypothetical protein